MVADSGLRADAARFGWMRAIVARSFGFLRGRLGVHVCHVRGRRLGQNDLLSVPGIALRALDPEQLVAVSADPTLGIDPDFAAAANRRGDIAYGAFDGERLVGYIFYATGCAPHVDGVWVQVPDKHRYGYKGFTDPRYRGRRINVALSVGSEGDFVARGITGHIGFVDLSNLSSLATLAAKGNRVLGYAGYLHWFGRCMPFRSPGARRAGFAFFVPKEA